MITYLKGILAEKSPTQAIVDVGGVGYEILIPLSSYDQLPAVDASVHILTHHHIREDAQVLFGFITGNEREMFKRLLDVNGIGPRLALAVLSGLSVRELKTAIVQGDHKRLNGISGIGKKTAERIIIELRDKISTGEAFEAVSGTGDLLPGEVRLRDAVMALISLGYKQVNALKLVRKAAENSDPDASVEDLVKRSLAG